MTGLGVEQLAWLAAVLLGCGFAFLGLLMLTPRGRPLARSLAGSAASLTLTVLVLFGAFLAGAWVLVLFLLLLSARIGFEAGDSHLGPGKGYLIAVISLLTSLFAISDERAALAIAAVWLILFGRFLGLPKARDGRRQSMTELALYPVLPMALLAHGAMAEELRPLVLAAYILIETFDSYALVFGKLMGRRAAFPALSPRKTVEGLIGGVVFLTLTVVATAVALGLSVFWATGLAILVGCLGLVGDLAASRIKRKAGIKDFPVVLGHQGGALDIFDSWIAVGAGLTVIFIVSGLV